MKLPDERQAYLIENLARLSWAAGANFIFRSYSNESEHLGPKTLEVTAKLCKEAAAANICPKEP